MFFFSVHLTREKGNPARQYYRIKKRTTTIPKPVHPNMKRNLFKLAMEMIADDLLGRKQLFKEIHYLQIITQMFRHTSNRHLSPKTTKPIIFLLEMKAVAIRLHATIVLHLTSSNQYVWFCVLYCEKGLEWYLVRKIKVGNANSQEKTGIFRHAEVSKPQSCSSSTLNQ